MVSGGFVLCEYEKVKLEFPEFQASLVALENSLTAACANDWGTSYGGTKPRTGQFGKSTIFPQLFYGFGGVLATAPLTSWNTYLTALGDQAIMAGTNFGNINEDYKIGFAGLAFLDKVQRITEIRLEIGSSKFPRINLEEAMVYNKPAVIFETGFILDENTDFDLHGYVESIGPSRVAMLGIQMNRVPNYLQTSPPGAILP